MALGDPITPAADIRMRDCVRFDSVSADASAGKPIRVHGLRHRAYYFSAIDNNDDWAAPRGVVACAWQGNELSELGVMRVITSTTTGIRFSTSATNPSGWLHVLSRGSLAFTTANDETPVQKGTAGFVQPGFIFLNHRSASPNTLTLNRIGRTAGLKFQIYPFTITDGDNVWLSETGRLCPGIVAVAWQGNAAADTAVVALKANGDVTFQSGTGGEVGYLWVWRGGAGTAT